jgi:hypothetical protein
MKIEAKQSLWEATLTGPGKEISELVRKIPESHEGALVMRTAALVQVRFLHFRQSREPGPNLLHFKMLRPAPSNCQFISIQAFVYGPSLYLYSTTQNTVMG